MIRTVIFALILLLGGYMAGSQLVKGRRCTEEAEATVVGRNVKRYSGGRGRRRTAYVPVVSFEAGGRTIQGAADIDSAFSTKYKDGTTLDIRYNPDNPEEFIVKGKSFRSGVLGGAALILIGLAGLWFSLR